MNSNTATKIPKDIMNKNLYARFDNEFKTKVVPYMERMLPRDWLAEPFYYYLDNVAIRKFRSGLPILIAESEEVKVEHAISIGTAAELIFCCSLIMDDIIDEDELRVSLPAAHIKYGNPRAVATAGLVMAVVDEMLCDLSDQNLDSAVTARIRRLFGAANARLMKSFLAERQHSGQHDLPLDNLLQVFRDKTITGTTALAAVGCVIPTNSSEALVGLLIDYGHLLGMAGQIKNDVHDFTVLAPTRGGSSDIRNQYTTYPVKKLLEASKENHSKVLAMLLSADDSSIAEELERHSIYLECGKDIDNYVDKAHALIKQMPLQDPSISLLSEWADCNRMPDPYRI